MSKKSLQILSLILSILGLVYLFLSYYGYIRYLSLHIYPIEKYIKDYPKLEIKKGRTVVCFNGDIQNIKPSLNSVLDQGIRVNDIGITLPYKDFNKVDSKLKKVLSLYGYTKDYKDCQNFIYSVLREPEADTKIILLSSDIIYGEDFIETMINQSEKHPDKIIYSKDATLVKPKFFNDKVSRYEDGVCVKDWIRECSNNKDIDIIEYNGNMKRM